MSEVELKEPKSSIEKGHVLELASDCGKLSTQVEMLCEFLDNVIAEDAPEELLRVRLFITKYFELISKTLKKSSYEIRRVVLGETKPEGDEWKKLGRDSQRLGFFSHNLLNLIETLIGETEDTKVLRLRDEYFKTCLLRASGLLKMVSTGIRLNKFSNKE